MKEIQVAQLHFMEIFSYRPKNWIKFYRFSIEGYT